MGGKGRVFRLWHDAQYLEQANASAEGARLGVKTFLAGSALTPICKHGQAIVIMANAECYPAARECALFFTYVK